MRVEDDRTGTRQAGDRVDVERAGRGYAEGGHGDRAIYVLGIGCVGPGRRRHRRMTGPIDARTTRTGLEARYRGVAVAADLTDAALGVDADLRTPRVRWIGDLPDAGVARAGAAATRRTTGVVLRGYAVGLVLTARLRTAGSGGGGLVRGGSQR